MENFTKQQVALNNEIMEIINKGEFIEGALVPENHESYVIMSFKNKRYEGLAKTNPIDYETEIPFFGCTLAEYRAIKQFLKSLKQETKSVLKEVTHLYNTFKNSPAIDSKDNSFKIIQKRYYYYCDKIVVIEDLNNQIDQVIQNHINWKETMDQYKQIFKVEDCECESYDKECESCD